MDNETVTKHTLQDLKELQALPLELKVRLTKQRIREWISYYGEDGVYVSFSGGKDSTVLLHIVRQEYEAVPGVFVDTGLEYPEIRDFVRTFDNIEWIKPKMNFRQVIQEYGYPFISKETSECVYQSVQWLERNNAQKPYMESAMSFKTKGMPQRLARLMGCFEKGWGKKKKTLAFNDDEKSAPFFQKEKWGFLIDSPYKIGSECCNIMKKKPFKEFCKKTGRVGMTAQMACESEMRKRVWLRTGCNAFNAKVPLSNPMSFWTEQDVLMYIRKNGLRIATVYGNIIEENEIAGQMAISDYIQAEQPRLKTTGCNRTGCIFCGYGCHHEKPGEGRFERLKITHPKIYEYIMKPWDAGGLGYKEVIDWLNESGNLHIRY